MKRQKSACMAVLGGLVGTMLLSGCGNNGCEEVREAYCMASLQPRTGATINTLSAWGIGHLGINEDNDTIPEDKEMFRPLSNPTEIEVLILNPNDTLTQIKLDMKTTYYGTVSEYTDTLTLRYQAEPHFIDMECGCSVFYNLVSAEVTHHFLRSVTIREKLVTNETTTNLVIEY